MRGSQKLTDEGSVRDGIIPAHAGLTFTQGSFRVLPRDHPRACGAHATGTFTARSRPGSSPRMRGSHDARKIKNSRTGIIPAHAGLTADVRMQRGPFWDHPRACGAHTFFKKVSIMNSGSSPRMRGSPICSSVSLSFMGIIPAHAGLTSPQPCRRPAGRDHPRACGAHYNVGRNRGVSVGSSPRMRGSL